MVYGVRHGFMFFSFYALEELSPVDKGSHENKLAAWY